MPCPADPGPRPGFIPVPDTARTVMRYEVYGQVVENVFYFARPGGWSATDLDNLNSEITDAWVSNLQPELTAQVQLLDITSTDQSVVSGAQDTDTIGAVGGNGDNGFETTGNTLAFKFTTGLSGRSYRGRMYWPLLRESEVSNGLVSAGFASGVRDALEGFFTDIAGAFDFFHVVVSYQNDCAWRTEGVATPVTGYGYTDLNLDSQRRRLPGRGI